MQQARLLKMVTIIDERVAEPPTPRLPKTLTEAEQRKLDLDMYAGLTMFLVAFKRRHLPEVKCCETCGK